MAQPAQAGYFMPYATGQILVVGDVVSDKNAHKQAPMFFGQTVKSNRREGEVSVMMVH